MFGHWSHTTVVIYGKTPSLVIMNITSNAKLTPIEYALVLSKAKIMSITIE